MVAWFSLIGFTFALGRAVFLAGGVYVEQWRWIALAIAGVALTHEIITRRADRPTPDWHLTAIWLLLFAVAICQIIPFPLAVIRWLSPERFHIIRDASPVLGMPSFAQLSEAPATTFDHLTRLTAYASAFFLARSLAWRFRDYAWIVIAPVLLIASLEAVLGISQLFLMRDSDMSGGVHGTYVNRNHFAGLLEMALPLALLGALAIWRAGSTRYNQSARPALLSGILLLVGATILVAIISSLSRTGFFTALSSLFVAGAIALIATQGRKRRFIRRTRWLALAALLGALCAATVFLPSDQLIARLAPADLEENLSSEARIQIWRDTLQVSRRYLATGCGLGAYEVALYAWKTAVPMLTVNYAHNDYLQLLVELGIPGALIAGSLAVIIIVRVFRFALGAKRKHHWELAVGLCASFTAIALHSITDFNLYIPSNALTLAWLAGAAASPVFVRDRATSPVEIYTPSAEHREVVAAHWPFQKRFR